MNSQEAIDYCQDIAERFDRDRYILTLAAEPKIRAALWAVLAFNHEIAKVRDVSRESVTGHIRLTWWRDAIADGKYSHEVLSALRPTLEHYNLDKSLFMDLIDARMRDADNTPPPTLDLYAAQTNGPLLKLFAKILGASESSETLHHLAIAYGLTGLMRSLNYFIRHDDRVLPADVLQDIGVAPEQFSHIKPDKKLFSYVRNIADTAQMHLDQAHVQTRFFKALKRMTVLHLKQLKRANYNPFDARYTRPIPFLALRVLL
ncbi:MAG TPA: squalene/phytoene synthase family protein [Alphaproteobacteria bacterium]